MSPWLLRPLLPRNRPVGGWLERALGSQEKLDRGEASEPKAGLVKPRRIEARSPRRVVPNQEKAVTTLPRTARTARPRWRMRPPQRAWRNESVPEDDENSAVFLGVPTPEAASGLIGPDAAMNGADEAEEEGEADDAIYHGGEALSAGASNRGFAREDEEGDAEEAGEEGGGIADGDGDDVGGEPEVAVEDARSGRPCVSPSPSEVVGDEEGGEPEGGCDGGDDAVAGETLGEESESDGDPGDEERGGMEVGDRGRPLSDNPPR